MIYLYDHENNWDVFAYIWVCNKGFIFSKQKGYKNSYDQNIFHTEQASFDDHSHSIFEHIDYQHQPKKNHKTQRYSVNSRWSYTI